MYKYEIKPSLKRILNKLSNKDSKKYKIILKKIEEIINSNNVEHYKNLRAPLNEYKRVHIDRSFVLIFKLLKNPKIISFEDFDHHDNIYKK